MKSARFNGFTLAVMVTTLLQITPVGGAESAARHVRVEPREIDDVLGNPGMGWQTFHRFADEEKATTFQVYWPPQDFHSTSRPATRPLLQGRFVTRLTDSSTNAGVLRPTVLLERPHDEAARQFWNSHLAFPEYSWMREVRVWDADHQWLWPNLSYLLRLPGIERVERYGGVDPGKGVDNDFAAVLIRKYDARGEHESADTKRMPLVSAEWHPSGITAKVNGQTIVRAVQSDEFTIHVGPLKEQAAGQIWVWLIYADFFGAKPPPGWPKTLEFAGGILAFFQVDWALKLDGSCQVGIAQKKPPRGTGFDWERWVTRTRMLRGTRATARLSD